MNNLLQYEEIKKQIISIRGTEIILDRDLSLMYGVETRVLKQAVRRNINRFPEEFMFELAENEINLMVSQSVIPSKSYFGGAKPFAFTEQGVSMLSSVIKTSVAVEISLKIIRTFVEMRRFLSSNGELFQRLDLIEKRQLAFEMKTDDKFEKIFSAIESNEVKPKQGIFLTGRHLTLIPLLQI